MGNCNGKSQQIAANHGKFSFKNNAVTFFKDCIAKCLQKRNGNHYGVDLLALFGDLYFLNLGCRGGGGTPPFPTKPLSNF